MDVLSTVPRENRLADSLLCSRLVEHSAIIRHGKIQRHLLHKLKNILLPSQNDYLQRLIEKTEQFLRRMRWKAYLFLNSGTISNTKDTYGFNSTKNPPPVEELKEFENDMLKMIQSTKLKHINSPFLNKLKDDAIKIKNETKLLIAADKTTNFYNLEPSAYNDFLNRTSPSPAKKHNLTP